MRLFVAVLPPEPAAGELAAALAPLHALPDAAALRWTEPRGRHLTLAFLGEVADPLRPELDEQLSRTARHHGPCELRLTAGGRFGDRALWTGAEGDLTGLCRLADAVRAAARRAGAPPVEEHPFRPHLTLARTLRSAPVALRPFTDALTGFHGSPWTADTLHLLSSALPPSGAPGGRPRYETVASWPLDGAPAAGRGADG